MKGAKLVDKKRCEMCGVVEHGKLCHEVFREYHKHEVCSFCLDKYWKPLEQKLGHPVKWDKLPRGWIVGRHQS